MAATVDSSLESSPMSEKKSLPHTVWSDSQTSATSSAEEVLRTPKAIAVDSNTVIDDFYLPEDEEHPSAELHAPVDDSTFSVDRLPSESLLREASNCPVVDEYGNSLPLGVLFPSQGEWQRSSDVPPPRTVLFFSGSFWCGPCQEYILHSVSQLNPELCAAGNVKVIIIACGSWRLSSRFRQVTRCPFPVYVDSARRLYKLFGLKVGNLAGMLKDRPPPEDPSKITQISSGFARACKMPLGNPGSFIQLGGEFVLSAGYKSIYAHRHTSKFRHVEAAEILRHAGVQNAIRVESMYAESVNDELLDELLELDEEMARWREERTHRALITGKRIPKVIVDRLNAHKALADGTEPESTVVASERGDGDVGSLTTADADHWRDEENGLEEIPVAEIASTNGSRASLAPSAAAEINASKAWLPRLPRSRSVNSTNSGRTEGPASKRNSGDRPREEDTREYLDNLFYRAPSSDAIDYSQPRRRSPVDRSPRPSTMVSLSSGIIRTTHSPPASSGDRTPSPPRTPSPTSLHSFGCEGKVTPQAYHEQRKPKHLRALEESARRAIVDHEQQLLEQLERRRNSQPTAGFP